MTRRRKYVIIAVIALVFLWLVNGWYQTRKNEASIFDQPEFTPIVRGNLDVPISATGSVEPASKTEIKCKASGTVEEVVFEAGDMVHKGDLLVRLDPVDENRNVENAEADLARATANLTLSDSELHQTERDWPTKVESALADLEAARAALQGAVVNFKRVDKIRQSGSGAQTEAMDVFDPNKVTTVELDPQGGPLASLAGKKIAVSERESANAGKLVDYGKNVINQHSGPGYWDKTGSTFTEYQEGLITMWQAQAKLLATMAEVRNAVNLRIMIEQARTKITLAKEAERMAQVALDQTKQRRDDTLVKAPSDGLVQEVFVKKGQIISSGITTVTGGTTLMMLADVKKLFVVSDVDEADIGRVRDLAPEDHSSRLGVILQKVLPSTQPVKLTKENDEEMEILRSANNVDVTVDAFREETFTGKVDRVDPNPKNVNNIVTYNVRILLTSPNRTLLMLGMHANVKFTSRKLVNILKVANEAIKVRNEERGVYIEGPNKKPLFIPVKVGLTDSTMIELKTDKVKAGQRVYVKLPASKEDEEKTKNDES